MNTVSFENIVIVSCGTLTMELTHLKKEGFLNAKQIFFTTPGLHQNIQELETQLVRQIKKAREITDKIIIIYGGKFCYVNADDPLRNMQTIINEQGKGIARINATHCMDMIVSETEREAIAQEVTAGEKVWWMTPGWVRFRKQVFKGWDKGLANENFPKHTGGAIVLDSIGYLDKYMEEQPEEFLEYCDWMGIPMQAYPVTLDRFKSLLSEQAKILMSN